MDGALFVPFPGVRVANPDRVFGTDETVALLTRAIVETQANSPGAPDLLMGDISIDGGGPLSPHRSHQSGRDVDIALYKLNGKFESSFKTATPETLDVATTWLFIETLLLTDRVQYIFLDSTLADALRRHVGLAFSGERLSTWFQFPRKRGTRAGVIRHASGHRDHMHIRFHCPPADYWCVD
ncbi:penicillin-insensitive murein endopeptidase [bacterium]|nr:penicillin-insensitive murein endopeptidase [bacterium]